MLAFLLDEQISHAVAEQIRQKRLDIRIESVLQFRKGDLRGKTDAVVLAAACEEGLTLVTYDQKTIPLLLAELAMNEGEHSGVIFVDRSTITPQDIGALTQALIAFHDQYHSFAWTNTVMFLTPAAR